MSALLHYNYYYIIIMSALNSLLQSKAGVLKLEDKINPSDTEGPSVYDLLIQKHPSARRPHDNALLRDPPSILNPIIFDHLNSDMILKAAMKTKGVAGLSGIDAYGWRRLLSHYKSASRNLCSALAAVGRRLCCSLVNPSSLQAFVACRLIPINKNPGVRPLVLGKFPIVSFPKLYCGSYLMIFRKQLALYRCVQVRLVDVRLLFMRWGLSLMLIQPRGYW